MADWSETEEGWALDITPPGSKCCAALMRVESGDDGTSYGVCSKCGRPADGAAGWLTVWRTNGVSADSEGPTLYTRDEFERFISNLRHAAAQVWPDESIQPWPTGEQGIAVKGPDVGMCGNAETLRARGNEVRPLEGGVIRRDDFPELYAMIQDQFGTAEPDEFRLPDLRGRVVKPDA